MNYVKVNLDAAISKDQNVMGMGVIVRDHTDNVLACICIYKPTAIEPTTAEAMAAWYAIEISKKMGVSYCILEGDAKEITHALQRDSPWKGSYCMLVNVARKNLK